MRESITLCITILGGKVTMKTMTNYEWSEEFYKELVIDYNYRFPKFMEISYPNQSEESNNE